MLLAEAGPVSSFGLPSLDRSAFGALHGRQYTSDRRPDVNVSRRVLVSLREADLERSRPAADARREIGRAHV